MNPEREHRRLRDEIARRLKEAPEAEKPKWRALLNRAQRTLLELPTKKRESAILKKNR